MHVGVGCHVQKPEIGVDCLRAATTQKTDLACVLVFVVEAVQGCSIVERRESAPSDKDVVGFVLLLCFCDVLFVDCVEDVDVDGHVYDVLDLEEDCAEGVLEYVVKNNAVSHCQVVCRAEIKRLIYFISIDCGLNE